MIKKDLTKLKVPQIGPLKEGEDRKHVVTEDPVRIDESLSSFFNVFLNGRIGKNMKDTGESFKPDFTHLDEFLENLSTLSPQGQATLDEDLTIDELEWIMKTCPYGKANGLDGLTYEFYRVAWPALGHSFHKVFQVQLDRCRLIESGKHGATRLITKIEAVPEARDLKPITLLQVDYRILSKCLASGLHSVIHEVVEPGQLATGNGNILTGVFKILSTIDFVNKFNSEAYILSADQIKAFDWAMVTYLEKVTKKMHFPRNCVTG